MSDRNLPTGPELADALFALGLAPSGCVRKPYTGEPYCHMWQGAAWEPWCCIASCWYLVELLGLSIEFSVRHNSWWIGRPSGVSVIVATFAEIPTGICQVAIKVRQGGRADGYTPIHVSG